MINSLFDGVLEAAVAMTKSSSLPSALGILMASYRFLILLQRPGHEILELADTSRIGRVRRH